jgi:hypothetical protein
MDKARADLILSEYDDVFAGFLTNMGHTQAQAAAARQVVDQAKFDAIEKRRTTQLQAAATQRQMIRMSEHTTVTGKPNPSGFLLDLVSNRSGARGQTLDGKYRVVRADLRGRMTDGIVKFRANLVGVRRNKETLRNFVREAFGEKTDDAAARTIAQSWAATAEVARTRFNAAGGHIAKRADWGLPQHHDARRARKAGYEAWKAEIVPRLDMAKMGENYNDGIPFTPSTLEVLLDSAYKAIASDGASRREPGSGKGRKSVGNTRADHRFFAFKSADDWMAYSERFGAGQDALRVMTGHLDNMAMEIALMEELGPNPHNTFAYIKDAAGILAGRSSDVDAPLVARKAQKTAQGLYDLLQGTSDVPHNLTGAAIGSAIRNYSTAALLGRAVISSLTDINTARVTSSFMGMSGLAPTKMMARIYKNPELRNELAASGLIFENAVDIGNAVARYEMEDMQFDAAARLADFTIRSTGLGWLTEARRQAFGGSVMHTIASDWRNKAHADLAPKTQRTLRDYGITKDDWALIRQAEVYTTPKGLTLTRPQDVKAVAGQAVADRYLEAIHSMTDFAVVSTDLRGRQMVLGNTQRGTINGELIRFGLQFKGFPITLLLTHVNRAVTEARQGRPGTALSYAASFIIGNTLLGGVAVQLKELAKGRDPQDMTKPSFWTKAFAQGGGVGIFGDFLFADHNRYGGGLGQTLAGPAVGLISDTAKLTLGNIADGGENIGRDTVDWLRRWTPGGSNWYWAQIYEREILDQLQQVVDPASSRSFRNKERNAQRSNTSYFYPPGSSLVTGEGRIRPPDLSNAVGD